MGKKKLVIVGGGFAGLRVLYRLADLDGIDIVLLDPRTTSLVKPALPDVAFTGKSIDNARFPLESTVHRAGARFLQTAALEVDPESRCIELLDGSRLEFDYLVLCVGAKKDYDAIPGFSEHGYSVCDDVEAPRLAYRLNELREGTVVIGSARSRWGTRVEIPALAAPCEGPVGEMMFMLDHELRRRRLRERVQLKVFSPGAAFFEDVGPAVHDAMAPLIDAAKIEIQTGKVLKAIHARDVEFEDGERWPSALTMVIPPYTGNPLVKASPGLGDEEGFIPTDCHMRHLDFAHVFAAGDGTALAMPKLGHIAVHQADIAAAALRRELTGEGRIPPFEPEVFCIMNRGGKDATMILSNTLFGGSTDRALSSPLAHMLKWGFDSFYYHTRGHLPPEITQQVLLELLERGNG